MDAETWAFLRLSQIVVAVFVIGCLIAAWRHKRPMATWRQP